MTTLADRYELRRPLGVGGMATVHEAWDATLQRAVAVKLLRLDLAGDPQAHARFLREAQTAAQIASPRVVRVFDAGVAPDGTPWLAMELVDGESLSALLRGRRLSPDEALDLMEEALDGLAAVHAVGVVHRDVKPGNILVGPQGAKLGDFGIARRVDSVTLTATGQVYGTPRYLPPEALTSAEPSMAGDVYAAGIVLYEALAGRPPFDGPHPLEVARAHREDPVPPLAVPGVAPGVEDVVRRALAKDPGARFRDAGALVAALRGERAAGSGVAALGAAGAVAAARAGVRAPERTLVVPATPPGARPPATAGPVPRRGFSAATILAVVALLVLAAGGLTYLVSGGGAPQPTPAVPAAPAATAATPGPAVAPPAPVPTVAATPTPTPAVPPQPAAPVPSTPTAAEDAGLLDGALDALVGAADLQAAAEVLDGADPEVVGPRAPELAAALRDVGDRPGRGRIRRLAEQIDTWVADGELAAPVGNHVLGLLAEAAAQAPGDGDEDGDGEGNGDDDD